MSQESIDIEMSINLLMEITELNYDQAASLLATHNHSLDAALNSHLDGGTNFMSDEMNEDFLNGILPIAGTSTTAITAVAAGGASAMTSATAAASAATSNSLIQDEDNVRSPIPPKREILLLPDEDNFRFRKRRNVSHNICPLRNFQREGEMQEQMLADAESLAEPPTLRCSKRMRLADLFLPPINLSFCGSFQAARDYATSENRWLIVNLQDNTEFASQALNRDIWREQIVFDMIKKYFIFWQIGIDNTEGARFQSFYSVNIIPYVCIIDPRTGEEKLGYKKVFHFSAIEFVNELKNYLREHSPFITIPNVLYGGEIYDVHFNDLNIEDTNSSIAEPSPSTSSASIIQYKNGEGSLAGSFNNNSTVNDIGINNNDIDGSHEYKKRQNLTESEQIALAIQNSIKDKKKYCDVNNSDNNSDGGDDGNHNQDIIEIDDSNDRIDLTKDEDDIVDIYNIHKVLKIEKDDHNDDDEVLNKLIENPSKSPITIIILRLPDNTRSVIEWPCTTKLLALNIYIKKAYPELTKEVYKIMCPFLKQDILLMNNNLTLKEANLHPSVTLHIQQDN